MQKNIFKVIRVVVMVLFVSLAYIGFSQGGPPGGGDPPGGEDPPIGAAISGGLFILLSLGAGYGGKKIYDWKKQLQEK